MEGSGLGLTEALSRNLCGGPEKINGKLIQNSLSLGWDLKPGRREYITGLRWTGHVARIQISRNKDRNFVRRPIGTASLLWLKMKFNTYLRFLGFWEEEIKQLSQNCVQCWNNNVSSRRVTLSGDSTYNSGSLFGHIHAGFESVNKYRTWIDSDRGTKRVWTEQKCPSYF